MRTTKYLIVAFAVFAASLSFAAVEKGNTAYHAAAHGLILPDPPSDGEDISDAQIAAMSNFGDKTVKRSVASGVEPNVSAMSAPYQQLVKDFVNETDPGKLLTKLNALNEQMKVLDDKNYDRSKDQLPVDYEFAAVQLIPLRVFAGIVHKMRPILEGQHARIVQDFAIDQIRGIFEKLTMYYPSDRWKLGVRLFTEPWTSDPQFGNEVDFQKYLANTVYPELDQSAKRLEKIDLHQSQVVWDNQIRYGDNAFGDGLNRFRWMGQAERDMALARIYKRLHWIAYTVSYNLGNVVQLKKTVGKQYGIDTVTVWNPVNGIPRMTVVGVMRQPKWAGAFHRNPGGDVWMKEAYRKLRTSIYYTVQAWNTVKDRKDFDYSLLDSNLLHARENETTDALRNAWSLVKAGDNEDGKAMIKGLITGKTVVVNLKNFYFNSPTDLKDLLPTGFDTDNAKLFKPIDGQSVEYRNYNYGNANNWRTDTYHNIFPELSDGRQVPDKMAILAEARGTKLVTQVLGSFSR